MGTSAQPPQSAPPTTDWRAKSIDVLSDATKQLITIATGIITATVIFSKDLTTIARGFALAAWIVLTISVILGVMVLYNVSGHLFNSALNSAQPDIQKGGMRFFSKLQIFFFFLGVIFVFIFGLAP